MLNQFISVGRLVKEPTMLETKDGKKMANVTLSVARPYKNIDGEYENDILEYSILGDMADRILEYCKNGDLLGIRGRITSEEVDGKNVMTILAEKITFLSSKKIDESETLDPELEQSNIGI